MFEVMFTKVRVVSYLSQSWEKRQICEGESWKEMRRMGNQLRRFLALCLRLRDGEALVDIIIILCLRSFRFCLFLELKMGLRNEEFKNSESNSNVSLPNQTKAREETYMNLMDWILTPSEVLYEVEARGMSHPPLLQTVAILMWLRNNLETRWQFRLR